ncbi:MAG TPA: subclass B3 metallo-beta-lactamase [Thermoanaerobaculia bacterium]
MKQLLVSATLLFCVSLTAAEIPSSWTKPVDPVRIVGNIHYVGTAELGAYLLVGDEGAILLDVPLEENASLVLKNIEALGVDPATVRILLNSHAHFDHAGGIAAVKKATGARLFLSAPDSELAARGGLNDFAFGDRVPYPPFAPDSILKDGETVRLGDLAMTAVFTPGHTRGCTTWRTTVVENDEPLDVVFLCSVTAPGYTLVDNEKYPEILDDYRRSFETLRGIDPDVFLANHGSFFDLTTKVQQLKAGKGNPFIVRGEFASYLTTAWKQLEDEVAKQSASCH